MKTNFRRSVCQASVGMASIGFMLLLSCAPQDKTPVGGGVASNLQHSNSILGGQDANDSFQKKNGVVGLLLVTQKIDAQGKAQESEAICTGSLISKRVILTASHCLLVPNIKAILAVFGTDMKTAIQQKAFIHAAKTISNESFNPNSAGGPFVEGQPWNDIGLIVLQADAPADFSFAKLPTQSDFNFLNNGAKLTLAGFGVTNPIVNNVKIVNGKEVINPIQNSAPDTAGTLRSVSNMVVFDVTKDAKEILVDQNGARGACHGDSGGPAYLENTDGSLSLIGVTSRGTDLDGNCDKQNVFTNVYGQLDWINKKIQSLNLTK